MESEKIGGSHIRIVQPGDTLHAIAFVNNLDVNKLAAWNRLSDTSKLLVGQRIRLTRPLDFQPSSVPPGKPSKQDSKNTATASTATNAKRNSRDASSGKTSAAQSTGNLKWQWPTDGRVVTAFNLASGQQGIDIQGTAGQTVTAALAGEVVYVGNGLKGYGNLVIIKHSQNFLSAYAHNRETFVQEGQRVAAEFRIATLGRDRRQRDALHFQIRKNGQPVNPLAYLPAR